MGRKSAHLKAVSGTAQPCRARIEIEIGTVLESAPPPPDWLPNAHAVKEWERLSPILVANKLLTDAALTTLGHLCALHGKIVQLWAAGETPTGHMLAQYIKLVDSFGIPPMAAGKVRPQGDGKKANQFGKFKEA